MNPPANDDESHGIGLYVINLDSSGMPMPLTVPFRHELVGFTVFRSRSFETRSRAFSPAPWLFRIGTARRRGVERRSQALPGRMDLGGSRVAPRLAGQHAQYRIPFAAHRLRACGNARERRGQGAKPRR